MRRSALFLYKNAFGKSSSYPSATGRKRLNCCLKDLCLLNNILHKCFAVELGGKFSNHFLVDQRIDVLSQLVKNEPISDLAFVGDVLDILMRRQSAAGAQQVETNLRPETNGHTVDERDARQDGQRDEPEPQEHEDFLVHDVQWKNA